MIFWSQPNIRSAVSAGVADLVGEGRAIRLLSEIDEEIFVYGHAAILVVNIDAEEHGTLPKSIKK